MLSVLRLLSCVALHFAAIAGAVFIPSSVSKKAIVHIENDEYRWVVSLDRQYPKKGRRGQKSHLVVTKSETIKSNTAFVGKKAKSNKRSESRKGERKRQKFSRKRKESKYQFFGIHCGKRKEVEIKRGKNRVLLINERVREA